MSHYASYCNLEVHPASNNITHTECQNPSSVIAARLEAKQPVKQTCPEGNHDSCELIAKEQNQMSTKAEHARSLIGSHPAIHWLHPGNPGNK